MRHCCSRSASPAATPLPPPLRKPQLAALPAVVGAADATGAGPYRPNWASDGPRLSCGGGAGAGAGVVAAAAATAEASKQRLACSFSTLCGNLRCNRHALPLEAVIFAGFACIRGLAWGNRRGYASVHKRHTSCCRMGTCSFAAGARVHKLQSDWGHVRRRRGSWRVPVVAARRVPVVAATVVDCAAVGLAEARATSRQPSLLPAGRAAARAA